MIGDGFDEPHDLGDLGAPNCPRCLAPMQLEGDERPRWACLECGLVRL